MSERAAAAQVAGGGEWFGHPRGLYVLFATEMWERFSYYGMRALLVLYLTRHFLFDDAMAAHSYGAYAGLVYALPVVGGLIADRWLGLRRAVIFGGVLLCLGHLAMAWEGSPARLLNDGTLWRDDFGLGMTFLAMAMIAVGVGFLKPNISSLVGRLYAPGDPRCDSGFTIFYMGINLGAALATLLVGWVGEVWGWSWGFGLAGVGMLLGLGTFVWGQRYLHGLAEAPDPAWLAQRRYGLCREHWIYLAAIVAVLLSQQGLSHYQWVGGALLVAFLGIYLFWGWFCLRLASVAERRHVVLVIILTFCSVLFWALFEQAGSSMTLFADRAVDRQLGGFELRASQIQALNPIFILLLGPLFAWLWPALRARGLLPGYAARFGLGITQAGLGFAVLAIGISLGVDDAKTALIWLVLAYLLHTTGELCLSPVGLSMVTQLSPVRLVGTMMGTWFLAVASASYIGGLLAALVDSSAASQAAAGAAYGALFATLGKMGLGIGLLVLLASPWLHRLERD